MADILRRIAKELLAEKLITDNEYIAIMMEIEKEVKYIGGQR